MEVRSLGRTRALLLLTVVSGMSCLTLLSPAGAVERDQPDTKRGLAIEAVREALQREVYGLTDDRERLLAEATAHDPELDAAHWHRGQVLDAQGRWVDHEQITGSAGLGEKLAEYEKVRDKYPNTVEGQLALAAWCAKRKLRPQQRAHLMHVLNLAPDHVQAREALGFVRMEGSWVSREELAAERERGAQAQRDLKAWRPTIQEILKDLRHRSEERRTAAKERLGEIHDPAALSALIEVVFSVQDEEAFVFLDGIAQMVVPDASLALAQAATFAPSQAVRQAAAQKLGERKLEEFVPQLLASLYSPVTSRATATLLPNGRLAFRHTFVREGMDQQQVLQLDTQYERRERFGGTRMETTGRAALHALNETMRRDQAAAMQNAMTEALNKRLMWVLSEATKEQFADPAGWWKWWNDRNEVFQGGSKDVAFVQQNKTVEVVDYVPPPPRQQSSDQPSGTGGGGGSGGAVQETGGARGGTTANLALSGDCLAAGTQIWTINGQTAIETVRIGDLVLSRSQDTGELAYKPVVKTSIRPRSQLIKLSIDGETIETSGGHLFWVSGEGWMRSRELKPGMILHGASGPARIESVEPGETAETYNVVVADFNTYFVGDSKVFSHDNTVRQPTRAIVPGLRME